LVTAASSEAESVAAAAHSLPCEALQHADSLYGFAYQLTKSSGGAEDLVQETFARALAAEEQFEAGTNLKGWLFRILRNVHLDGLRRARRHPTLDLDEGAHAESSRRYEQGIEHLRGDAELEALRHLVAEDIDAALATLSNDARAVVLLDFEGFTELELAEVLGCAPGTVKSRLARARATLRQRLEEYRQ
jgi:RNA polymerase sigma-70 factor (ECF subfamily)